MSDEIASGLGLPTVAPVGDSAVGVLFGSEIDDAVNDRVYAFSDAVDSASPEWLIELVPTYRSLLVSYDSLRFDYLEVASELERIAESLPTDARSDESRTTKVFELPTVYGGEHGPDLESVAGHTGLSVEEVITIHSGTAYRVYMIGFSPGFPYLGGMDKRIATPRLPTPRTRVPAGSVGIAESQTGVYPDASPGGWQLIGRTPVRLFDPADEPPSLLQPGHFVRFVPVGEDEFQRIASQVENGEFAVSVVEMNS